MFLQYNIVWGGGIERCRFKNRLFSEEAGFSLQSLPSLSNTCGKALNPTHPAVCLGLNMGFQVLKKV